MSLDNPNATGDRIGGLSVRRASASQSNKLESYEDQEYTEYKGVGHDSWTPTHKNAEVLEWLFRQKASVSR